ncbi:MAG: DUF58 domain-containing protein [Verrucomicrobia bacterium]|nr:DUF58 domain-containing protein [Verrucomicrobiota bacterium]
MSAPGTSPATSPPVDLLRRARLVELRARGWVEDLFAGPYRSVFRGRGLEFDDLRVYQPGDDVRSIDWHAAARTGTVQIKQNVEERCLTLLLAVDVSASGDFGSVPQSKRELAAELAAVLALSAVLNNDRVGLLLFTDRVERYLPPRAGRRQALAIVTAVLGHAPVSPRTSVRTALHTLGLAFRRRATVFLLSDFLDTGFDRALAVAARRHDLVAVVLGDPVEARLPDVGWLVCEDAETGELLEINTRDATARHAFEVEHLARAAHLADTFRRAGVDAVACESGRPCYRALLQFFDRRQRRPRAPAR